MFFGRFLDNGVIVLSLRLVDGLAVDVTVLKGARGPVTREHLGALVCPPCFGVVANGGGGSKSVEGVINARENGVADVLGFLGGVKDGEGVETRDGGDACCEEHMFRFRFTFDSGGGQGGGAMLESKERRRGL